MNETIFISDVEEIKKINQDFREARKVINKKIYNSPTDEENREIINEHSRTFKATLDEIYPLILGNLFNNYPELQDQRAKRGAYFIVVMNNNQLPVKVVQKNDHEISLLWFGHDGTKYEQKVSLTPIRDKKVRVDYVSSTKGFRTVDNREEREWRRRYMDYQNLNFKLQSTEVMLKLTSDLKQVAKLKAKKEKYQHKIDRKYH